MFSFFYLIIVFQLATMVVIYSRFTTLILSVEINTTAWKKKKKKRSDFSQNKNKDAITNSVYDLITSKT
jgi:hypothetical protein